jgi:hypothetical protein
VRKAWPLLLALAPALARADGPEARRWRFGVDPWSASCRPVADGEPADCGLPARAAPRTEITLETPAIDTPANASVREERFEFAGSAGAANATYRGRLSVFVVYPALASGQPAYDQVRLELWLPVRVTCYQSVRRKNPAEHPPLICSGSSEDRTFLAGANLLLLDASAPAP